MQEDKQIEITPQILKGLSMAKIFKNLVFSFPLIIRQHVKEINSIDFSKDGKKLLSADETNLNIFDAETAKLDKILRLETKKI